MFPEFDEAVEAIERACRERIRLRAKVQWVGEDAALRRRLEAAGAPNPRGRATICGAHHFDHQDEHGRPVAIGVEGQFIWPEARITAFPMPRHHPKEEEPR